MSDIVPSPDPSTVNLNPKEKVENESTLADLFALDPVSFQLLPFLYFHPPFVDLLFPRSPFFQKYSEVDFQKSTAISPEDL